VLRQRQLQQDARDPGVGGQLVEHCGELVLGDVGGQVAVQVAHPGLDALAALVAHVDRRRGVVADQQRGQSRRRGQPGDLAGDLGAHAGGDGLAVDEGGGHGDSIQELQGRRAPATLAARPDPVIGTARKPRCREVVPIDNAGRAVRGGGGDRDWPVWARGSYSPWTTGRTRRCAAP
jgi:hypothetical protein